MFTSRFSPRINATPSVRPDLAAQAAGLRRWTFLMIGSTVVVASAFVGVQIYLMKATAKAHDETNDKPMPPAWASQAPLYQARPLSARAPEATPKSNPHEAMLEVIGGLTRAHLTQTCVTIGLLADAIESEKPIYTFADANNLLEEITNFIDEVERQFVQLPPSAFQTEEDRKDMEQARTVTTLLRTQAKELKAYWATGAKDHAERFQKARGETWDGIKKLSHSAEEH